ncbi:MAG: hypothetical protein C4342_08130 [Armatimonadota bacterium]
MQALNEGVVALAGLDVLEHEAVLRGSVPAQAHEERRVAAGRALMSHPRVIVTPHMAFFTREAFIRLREATARIIREHLARMPA